MDESPFSATPLSEDAKVKLRERQNELLMILEAYAALEKTDAWRTIRESVFDKSVAQIERAMLNEAKAEEVDFKKTYRLQGEFAWAKQFCEVGRFVALLTRELAGIKKVLQ